MEKYRGPAEKKLKGMHPDLQAKEALVKAEFASRQREEFFTGAYGELMVDYYLQFLRTEPHEHKAREFIYSCVLALGDVKSKLAQYEMYGKNVPHLEDNGNAQD
ncbi:MAG: hypothetical protein GDA45_07380 [Chromatiales bacterium]|nr:hypothetical protein [Chromatiales bacterium]